MLGQILVPLDGSTMAEAALPYVQLMARLAAARITLLHVVALPQLVAGQSTMAVVRAVPERAQSYMRELAERLQHQGNEVTVRIEAGVPSETISAAAGDHDLVVITTGYHVGIQRGAPDSMVDRVLHGSRTPLLVVRGHLGALLPPPQLRRILVPLDGSPVAEQALSMARFLAAVSGARLILAQCVSFAHLSEAALLQAATQRAAAYLRSVCQRLQRSGLDVQMDVRLAPPVNGISASAVEQHADLLVLCTHGTRGPGRAALGSVAAHVLQTALPPVLLVRAAGV